jgi:hypothetical protein
MRRQTLKATKNLDSKGTIRGGSFVSFLRIKAIAVTTILLTSSIPF